MFCSRRAVLAVCFSLLWPAGLCAFDVTYGLFFVVKSLTWRDGRPVLPLSRGKYADARVLDQETFAFLKTCEEDCTQTPPDGAGRVALMEIRPAKTRSGMWIVDASFDGRWRITFLVFKNKTGYGVKPPEHFEFLDGALKARTEKLLADAAENFPEE